MVGIVSESDLVLSDEESDLHLPHYLNIMGGIVFVGSMKGFEERLDKAFATKVSELMTADPVVVTTTPAPRRWRGRSPRSTTTTSPWSTTRVASPAWSRGPTRSPRSSRLAMVRAVARIDLGAVQRNCARLKSELAQGAELCAVVKADGYGHGADACADAALTGGATRLAVATGDEAAQIGRRLAHVPLLTMGALGPEDLDAALAAGSEVAVWREGFLRLSPLGRARRAAPPASTSSTTAAWAGSATATRARCWRCCAPAPRAPTSSRRVSGPTSPPPTSPTRTSSTSSSVASPRWSRRRRPSSQRITAHAANSAAVFRDRRSHFDMARCGVAVYGLDPFQGDPAERGLSPALSLHSYVADVKRFEPGDSAGYGRNLAGGRARPGSACCRSATATGCGAASPTTPRCSSAVAAYPLVGTVSMDNVTIDLGPETDVEPGDEAVLIGSQGEEAILAEELAARLGTINYEITCGISARVPRVEE